MKITHVLIVFGLLAILLGCGRANSGAPTTVDANPDAVLIYNSYQGAGSN